MINWDTTLKQPKGTPPYFLIKGKLTDRRNETVIQIIVSLGNGFQHSQGYKKYKVNPVLNQWGWNADGHLESKGINVLLSMNGPAPMTFTEFGEIQVLVENAKEALEAL